MMVRVRVRGSPYQSVRPGAIGEVVERKYIGTTYEVLKVCFPGGILWTLRPDELERLDGEAL